MSDTLDPIGGMLKDEGFCIFILVITSVTLDSTMGYENKYLKWLKSP
jgi:hypothetical protein